MPSLTVVVSSDTDICFSPGLYGDCLPTVATGGAPESFRVLLLSCSHTRGRAGKGLGRTPFGTGCVTSTLSPSSK
ncbi:hypothetical protein GT350_30165 [Streptomyces sp. SID1034]|nr:hypothetical protein [Streptomyces sp. SID1034]